MPRPPKPGMSKYWLRWYSLHDVTKMRFRICRNESETYWQVRGDDKHLMTCRDYAEAIEVLYRFWRGRDPQVTYVPRKERQDEVLSD